MNDIYLWCVTGMAAVVALNTIWRLWTERDRLLREDLSDEDRAFAWRVVIFVIFPLLNFIDLRSTMVACNLLGGYVKSWSYGLMWFHVQPVGLPEHQLIIPVFLAGAVFQLLLAVFLLPALLFRPHPFIATLVGYTAAFTFGLNLIIDPLLALVGMGSPRWQIVYGLLSHHERAIFLTVHIAAAALYIIAMLSQSIRLVFAGLSRPGACDELKKALAEYRSCPGSVRLACLVGLLYDRAGLRRRARAQLKHLTTRDSDSLYTTFLQSLLLYKRRDYRLSRQAFITSSDYPGVDGSLKASLLAAAACCAFADEDVTGALNLASRAIEFDDFCLVARMVKVDALLRQGKKEEAGEELLLAMREGLILDLEKKVPLDADEVFESLVALEAKLGPGLRLPGRELQVQSSSR